MKLKVSNRDVGQKKYIIKLEENILQEEFCLESDTVVMKHIYRRGGPWNKKEKPKIHWKAKEIFGKEFFVGLRTGMKEDPILAAKEMRLATSGGKPLFSLEEL